MQVAQQVIDTQREINQQLRSLAEADELEVADDAKPGRSGRTMVRSCADGKSLIRAYADNLASVARELADLFESAAASDLGELSG